MITQTTPLSEMHIVCQFCTLRANNKYEEETPKYYSNFYLIFLHSYILCFLVT
jgi:hypothetical protein